MAWAASDPANIVLGQRLRLARNAANMSLVDAANTLGITHQALAKFEAGFGILQAHRLKEFALLYNVGILWLLGMTSTGRANHFKAPALKRRR